MCRCPANAGRRSHNVNIITHTTNFNIMTKNFRVYVDRGGNMPQLRHSVWECATHPYYIRYVNDRPVAYHGPADIVAGNVSKDSVWCYRRCEFIAVNSLIAE